MSDGTEKTVIQKIEELKETSEFKTLIENSNQQYWESKIGNEVKTIYGGVDSILKDVLGIEKDPSLKTTEQLKAAMVDLLAKSKENKSEGVSVEDSQEYKLLLDKSKHTDKALEASLAKFAALEGSQLRMKIDADISRNLSGLEFNPVYSKDDLAEIISVRKSKLITNASTLEDGSVIYYTDKEKTKAYRNTLGAIMTSEEVASVVFGSLLKATKKGGNSQTTTLAVAEGKAITLDMSSIKSKSDFYAEFNKSVAPKGLASHEKDFLEIQRATEEFYNIKALPLT